MRRFGGEGVVRKIHSYLLILHSKETERKLTFSIYSKDTEQKLTLDPHPRKQIFPLIPSTRVINLDLCLQGDLGRL